MQAEKLKDNNHQTLIQLKEFFSNQVPVEIKKGEAFLNYGEPNQKLGILMEGLMYATYVSDSGQEWISRFFYPPENSILSSHNSFLSGENSTECIRAYENSKFIFIEKKEFDTLLKESTRLQHLVRLMAEESYVMAMKRVHILQSLTASQRVKHFMKEHNNLVNRVQRQHIASYLGIHRNIFTRILNKI